MSRFTVTTFTANRVVIKRQDIGGAQPHFSGTYSGARLGNSVMRGDGSVADIGSGMGTWAATWSGGSPTGCPDMPVGHPPNDSTHADTTQKLLAWLDDVCKDLLVLKLSPGPFLPGYIEPGHSQPCTVYIEDWRRNTSKPVVVDFPNQIDSYGGHENGITVFPASDSNFSLQRVDPANMSGFRSGWPEAQPRHSGHEVYAWNLMFSARQTPGGPVPIRVYQEGDHEKGVVHLTVNTRVDSSARASGDPDATAPLRLFWHAGRGDNFTTATEDGERAARAAGYVFVRIEGYVFRNQRPGTVPLKLYYNSRRGDNHTTTATSQTERSILAAGYGLARIEGYVYPTQRAGTVPLKVFWSGPREDNFTLATVEGEQAARASGYGFAFVDGYVLPATSGNSAIVRLVAKHSNRCLDIAGGDQSGRANGSGAHQWDCLDVRSQQWTFNSTDGQWFQLRTGHSQKCLDIDRQMTGNNTRVHQWDCHNGDSQLWKVVDRGQGTFALVSKLANRCIDIFGVETRNGAVGQLYDCHYGPNQLWTIRR